MANYRETKWDARNWSEDEKRAWQEKMFAEGCTWSGESVCNLDAAHYFINSEGGLGWGRDHEQSYFDGCDYKQMYWRDVFPQVPSVTALTSREAIETALANEYVLNLTRDIDNMIEDGKKTVRLRPEHVKQLLDEVMASRGISLPVYHHAEFDAPWKAAKAQAFGSIMYRKDGNDYKRVETEQEACSFWDELYYE